MYSITHFNLGVVEGVLLGFGLSEFLGRTCLNDNRPITVPAKYGPLLRVAPIVSIAYTLWLIHYTKQKMKKNKYKPQCVYLHNV